MDEIHPGHGQRFRRPNILVSLNVPIPYKHYIDILNIALVF